MIDKCECSDDQLHGTRAKLIIRARVAKFVNSYPNIEVSYSVEDADSLTSSDPITINVTLDRDADESDPDDQVADAPHFPQRKMVSWWLVVGDAKTHQLHAIKKVTVKAKLETKLDFTLGEGEWNFKLYLICDAYSGELALLIRTGHWNSLTDECGIGADQVFDLEPLKVVEGESSEEEDSDDAMDED